MSDLKDLLSGVENLKVNIKLEEFEKSLEELREIVSTYLDLELSGEFQLSPEKAFEFGRKARNEHSLTLRDVKTLVEVAVPEVFEERAGEIKTMLCHQFYENYLGYFVSGLYHDIIVNKTLKIEVKMPKLIARSRVGYRWGFGYKHPGGELIISGFAGGYVGEAMRGGRIVVTGFTGDYVGKGMKGGEIIVKGGVGWRLGDSMKGGKIVVIGDAGEFTGMNMKGGLIRVKGSIMSLGKREGGKIEVWKGKWVEV